MHRRITAKELTGLDNQEMAFLLEYLKDFHEVRAAKKSGFSPEEAHKLVRKPKIKAAIEHVLATRLESSDIDPEWVMMELVDNHMLARESGKLSASNTALTTIAKLATVDAFAAEKIITSTDQQVLDRLQRARRRANGISDPVVQDQVDQAPVTQSNAGSSGVSFI